MIKESNERNYRSRYIGLIVLLLCLCSIGVVRTRSSQNPQVPSSQTVLSQISANDVYQNSKKHSQLNVQVMTAKKPIFAVAFSHDGKMLASVGGEEDDLGEIALWSTQTKKIIRAVRGHRRSISCVAFSPNDKLVATGSYDGEVKIWDVATGECLHTLTPQERNFGFYTDENREGKPKLYSSKTTTSKGTPFFSLVSDVAFSRDGKTLFSGNWDGMLASWNVAKGTLTDVVQVANGTTMKWKFSPNAKWVVTNNAAFYNSVVGNAIDSIVVNASIFDVRRSLNEGTNSTQFADAYKTGKQIRPRYREGLDIPDPYSFAFSADSRYLLTSGPKYDRAVKFQGYGFRLTDTQTQKDVWFVSDLQWHKSPVALSKEGDVFIVLTSNELIVKRVKDARLVKQIRATTLKHLVAQNAVQSPLAISDNSRFAASSNGSELYLWNLY